MFYWRKNQRRTEIICTICSKEKNEDRKPMPAVKRYLGEHIGRAQSVAAHERRRFFILSGVYGLVRENADVPYYDQRLKEGKIGELAARVAWQIGVHRISIIRYYHEPKDSWKPYTQVLQEAQKLTGVGLILQALPITQQESVVPIAQMLVAPATA